MKPTIAVIALFIAAVFAGPALANGCLVVYPAGTSSDSWLNVAADGQRGVPEQEPYASQLYAGAQHREMAVNGPAYSRQRVVPEGQNGVPEQDSFLWPTDGETSNQDRIAENGGARDWQSVAAEGQRGVSEQEPFAGAC